MLMIVALPKIVRFLGTRDAGEFGAASCPHCGAPGRYVHSFQLADGRQAGAMTGRIKLFPVSPAAREEQRLRTKAAEYEKKGWKLNKHDQRAVEALENFFAGKCDEQTALNIVNTAKMVNTMRYRR